jgi:CubicO group peptidase (beta-lactamase class C family)
VYDFAEVSAIVDTFVAERSLNGVGLVVVERDEGVIHEEYWGEFDAERISLIASSGKVVTSAVLMSLDDQGILDVDAPVADVVEWGAANPAITPAQLLSNSSGLVGLTETSAHESYGCIFVAETTLQDCAEQVFTSTDDDAAVIPPDTEFRYGGAQWSVAGAVAEVASGRTWVQLVDELIALPCGLESLGYNIIGADYNGDPATLPPTDNPSPEAGAYITAPDYARLLLMQLRDGKCGDEQVLSSEAVEEMTADRIGEVYGGDTGGDGTGGYGMGWWVDRTSGRRLAYGAFGAIPWLDLENDFGVYLVTEAGTGVANDLATLLFDPIETAVVG